MPITVCPVTPGFVAEIGDADLSTPLEPADLLAIKEAFATYAVLIFPDQHLSQDQHLDFARNFGPLETTIALFRKDAKLRVRKEFADVSNLDADNKVWGENSRGRLNELSVCHSRLPSSNMRRREFSPQTLLSASRLETSANSLRTRNFASLRNSAIVVSSGPKFLAKSRC